MADLGVMPIVKYFQQEIEFDVCDGNFDLMKKVSSKICGSEPL